MSNEKLISVRPETYRQLREIRDKKTVGAKSFDSVIRTLIKHAKYRRETVEVLEDVPEVS